VAPSFAHGKTHRDSTVFAAFISKIIGNLSLESPLARLLLRGNGALRTNMHHRHPALHTALSMKSERATAAPAGQFSCRLAGLAHGFRLQVSMLRGEAWQDGDSRRWGSAYDFAQNLTRPIGRVEADCREPAPSAALFPGPRQASPQTKATILLWVATLRASPLARGRA
jgi:hypothetical protein